MDILKYLIIGILVLFPILILGIVWDVFGFIGICVAVVFGFFAFLCLQLKGLKKILEELNNKIDNLK